MKGGCLQQVLNIVICLQLEKFDILENWLLRRCDGLQKMVATEGSTVLNFTLSMTSLQSKVMMIEKL